MTINNKTPASGGTLTRAAETMAGRLPHSDTKSTMKEHQGQAIILDLLPVERENATTARDQVSMLDLTVWDVSRTIERLRADDVPVCASCGAAHPSYFLAEGAANLESIVLIAASGRLGGRERHWRILLRGRLAISDWRAE